jgi:spore germination protein GerM
MKKGFVIGIFLILLLAACGPAADNSTPPSQSPSSSQGEGQSPAEPVETKTTSVITVYYSNSDLTDLLSEEVSITYQEESDKYRETFLQLTKSPDTSLESLWVEGQLNNVRFEDGTLFVDVTLSNEQNLGSTGELFAIDALTKTFFQYEEVKSIQILVDGQITETLMGHVEITEPFQRP